MSVGRVLLVEDEPGLARAVEDRLRAEGYEVEVAAHGDDGLQRASRAADHDVVVLDVMLPGIDGFEVCHRLRRAGVRTPILMLTARAEVADRVHGLRLGADDYLTKPFDPAELSARIAALLRRARQPVVAEEPERFGELEVDLQGMVVRRSGEELDLSFMEFQLFAYLLRNAGRTLSREEILRDVWGFAQAPRTRTVDVHVTWLRAKIEPDRARPKHIHSVRGVGYRFSRGPEI